MRSCKEVSRTIASDELEGAGLAKRLTVWFHLLMCRYCRRYSRQIRAIGAATRAVRSARPTSEQTARLVRLKEALLDKNLEEPTA